MNHLKAKEIQNFIEKEYKHPLNKKAARLSRNLGAATGLSSLGVHLVRLKPGQESTALHTHHNEEECIYILEGQGTSVIGETKKTVNKGDFIAYPKKGGAHKLINTSESDLLYLLVGEKHEKEVIDYPNQGKRMERKGDKKNYSNL